MLPLPTVVVCCDLPGPLLVVVVVIEVVVVIGGACCWRAPDVVCARDWSGFAVDVLPSTFDVEVKVDVGTFDCTLVMTVWSGTLRMVGMVVC